MQINERISPTAQSLPVTPVVYGIKTLNGELAPWRLRPRPIPMYEESKVGVHTVRASQSTLSAEEWTAGLRDQKAILLPENSSHTLELQADVHSTACLRWTFEATKPSSVCLKVTYSEGYELDPREYPFFRTKADRLDATNGHLIGPFDDVHLEVSDSKPLIYEPFWFRTFRLLRLEITVGSEPVALAGFEATQVNYPLTVKASWDNPGDPDTGAIWDVSVRTLRNCMFDGYSDCPFYEQLQYAPSFPILYISNKIGTPVTPAPSASSTTSSPATTGSCAKQSPTTQRQLHSKASRSHGSHRMFRKLSRDSPSTGSCRYATTIYISGIRDSPACFFPVLMVFLNSSTRILTTSVL